MIDTPDPSPRVTIIVFIVVVLAVIGGAALLLATRPAPVQITINPPIPTPTPQPSATPAPITVYVTGAVQQPEQTYSVPAGSRAQDAIDAAGGVTDGADLTRVNLAQILQDGDQIHVPEVIAEEASEEVVLPTPSGGMRKVNVNIATLEELMELPGVGEAMAGRILEYRATNGDFTSLADLDEVSGIGPAMLENLEDLVIFQ